MLFRGNLGDGSTKNNFRDFEISSDPINYEMTEMEGGNYGNPVQVRQLDLNADMSVSGLNKMDRLPTKVDNKRRWKRVARQVDQPAVIMDLGKQKESYLIDVTISIKKQKFVNDVGRFWIT